MGHYIEWIDDGLAGVTRCGRTSVDIVLTAPDGPMGGDGDDDHYARLCPICGNRLVLRWQVRVEVLPALTAGEGA